MRLVVGHAVLLLAALGVAFQTWTRDQGGPEAPGSVALWSSTPAQVTSVLYEGARAHVSLERRRDERGDYLWASVGSGAETAEGAERPGERTEFLVGERGDALLERLAAPRALRELDGVDEEREREYGLDEPTARLVVELGSETHELLIGGTVFGTGHRYAKDPARDRAYVVPGTLLTSLEDARGALPERRPHDFETDRVASVVLRTDRGERTMVRSEADGDGPASWAPADAPERTDQTFANFLNRIQSLWLLDFAPSVDASALERRLRVDYLDRDGRPLGHMELLREEGEDGTEYYLLSEHSRTLARISRSVAESLDQDVEQLF